MPIRGFTDSLYNEFDGGLDFVGNRIDGRRTPNETNLQDAYGKCEDLERVIDKALEAYELERRAPPPEDRKKSRGERALRKATPSPVRSLRRPPSPLQPPRKPAGRAWSYYDCETSLADRLDWAVGDKVEVFSVALRKWTRAVIEDVVSSEPQIPGDYLVVKYTVEDKPVTAEVHRHNRRKVRACRRYKGSVMGATYGGPDRLHGEFQELSPEHIAELFPADSSYAGSRVGSSADRSKGSRAKGRRPAGRDIKFRASYQVPSDYEPPKGRDTPSRASSSGYDRAKGKGKRPDSARSSVLTGQWGKAYVERNGNAEPLL